MTDSINLSFVGPDQRLAIAAAKRAEAVLADAGFVIVSGDLALGGASKIAIVAADLAGANTIGEVAGVVGAVANLAPVADEVAALAPRADDVATLAPRAADIATLAPKAANIATLAPKAADIATLAPRAADIATLAPKAADIATLAPKAADISTVASNIDPLSVAIAQVIASGDLSHRYTTPALALAGTTDGQYSTVTLANGLAVDTYLRASGALTLKTPTLMQGGIALGQKIALLSAPGAVTPLPAGWIVSLDPVMAAITDDRYVPTSMAATVTHNAHPGGTEQYAVTNGGVLTKNYATDNGFAVHRLQLSTHNQLFSLSAALAAGLIKGKFLIKSTPGAGNQNITAGLYPSFMDVYAITEAAWTTVTFSRTTAVNNNVNIWNNADVFPVDVIFREDVQVDLDGESIPATEPSRVGAALRRTNITRAGAITRGTGNSVVSPFIGRIPLSTRDDNGVTFTEGTWIVALREDVANGANACGALFAPLLGGVTGYNLNGVVIGTQGNILDLNARGLRLTTYVGGPITGKGWVVGAVRFGPTGRSLHLNGVQIAEDTTAAASFTVPYACWGGGGYQDAQPLNGRVGVPVIYPTALSDDALTQACKNVRDRHLVMGDVFPTWNFVVPEGDSNTAGTTDTYAFQARDAMGLKPFWRMTAASGSTLNAATPMTGRLPLVTKMGRAVVAMGGRPILTMMIGANGLPSQADLRSYWSLVRAAGYKILVQPPTYRTGGTFSNAQNDTFRAMLESEYALGNFDAYSNIFQLPLIASQTFATDAPGGVANTLDGLHWTTAVYTLVAPVYQAALATLML